MTDRYADLRADLDEADAWGWRSPVARTSTIRALLADYDRMRDALWLLAEHNALHFGEGHNTVILARAALAQEKS